MTKCNNLKINLPYNVGDRVRITDIETDGTIDAVMIEAGESISVRVEYWYDGHRRQTWMTPREFTVKH